MRRRRLIYPHWCGPSTKRASLLRVRNKASVRRVYDCAGACVRDEPRDASAPHATFGVVGNCATHASLDTPQRNIQRASSGGNHHEAASDCPCMSRLPRNGRGFWIRGRERRYESRRQWRVKHFDQFVRRWLLSAAGGNAQHVAQLSAQPAACCMFANPFVRRTPGVIGCTEVSVDRQTLCQCSRQRPTFEC